MKHICAELMGSIEDRHSLRADNAALAAKVKELEGYKTVCCVSGVYPVGWCSMHARLFDDCRKIYSDNLEIMKLQPRLALLEKAVGYMADPNNWIDEDGWLQMKRPGGGRQEGIFISSHDLKPWVFIRDAVKVELTVAEKENF